MPSTTQGSPIVGSRVAVSALAVVAFGIAALRAMPSMGTVDRGVFVSVAERMVAGDRLYVDVWDNKDPLFYYLMATGRLISPLADYVLELLWLGVLAVAVMALAQQVATSRLAALAAASVALLSITGTPYLAGYTYLPGTALVAVAVALVARRRYGWAGLALGALIFAKPLLLPLGLAAALPWWWRSRSLGAPTADTTRRAALARGALGAVAASAGFAAVLALRGELGGWLAAQADNAGYSQSRLSGDDQNPVVDHLTRVIGPHELVVLLAVVVTAAGVLWFVRGCGPGAVLAYSTFASVAAAVIVLSATGLGPLHNQLLQLPVALTCALIALPVASLLHRRAGVLAVLLLVPAWAWVLGGATPVSSYQDSVRFFRGNAGVLVQTPADADAILTLGPTGSYARLGGEYDDGHARGLGSWDLVCPRFHQYFFQPTATLDATLACAETAPVILVSPSFETKPADLGHPAWNQFVTAGEKLLATDYDCVRHEGFRLCTRKSD